jgi:hypothetical protein
MVANELVRAESAAILRHARVIQIKRAALGLAPGHKQYVPCLRPPKRPRILFIFPQRHAKLFRACAVIRAR